VYEALNRAADPDGLVTAALDEVIDGTAVSTAVDVGCGTGYHLPMLAQRAETVVGVEPHPALAEAARRRVARAHLASRVRLRHGLAEHLPLDEGSVDLVFSHWAYFWGPGCEPGLLEADRVLRAGGLQVAIALDSSADTGYAGWFGSGPHRAPAAAIDAFFVDRGWTTRRLPVVWRFRRRSDLADVLRIEFSPHVAATALAQTVGTTIAVPSVLRWRRR
jgi:SAM-dependent methyltransferase